MASALTSLALPSSLSWPSSPGLSARVAPLIVRGAPLCSKTEVAGAPSEPPIFQGAPPVQLVATSLSTAAPLVIASGPATAKVPLPAISR